MVETAAGREAWVWLDSWAGRTSHRVEVIGETPRRYRVRWLDGPAFRFQTGGVYLVPKHAVRDEPVKEQ